MKERKRERGRREKEREEQREREERNRRQAEEEEEEHGQCISIMRQARIRVLEWDAAASHAVANSATTSAKDSRTRSISSRYSISISKKRLRDAKTDRETTVFIPLCIRVALASIENAQDNTKKSPSFSILNFTRLSFDRISFARGYDALLSLYACPVLRE